MFRKTGILFVQLKEDVVEPWFRSAGKNLMDLARGKSTCDPVFVFALSRRDSVARLARIIAVQFFLSPADLISGIELAPRQHTLTRNG